jgi:hypothetical protein
MHTLEPVVHLVCIRCAPLVHGWYMTRLSRKLILPDRLKGLIQGDNQPFDARDQQAPARGPIHERRRGRPGPGRQLRHKSVLAGAHRSPIGSPEQQLSPAIENQDLGLASLAELRHHRRGFHRPLPCRASPLEFRCRTGDGREHGGGQERQDGLAPRGSVAPVIGPSACCRRRCTAHSPSGPYAQAQGASPAHGGPKDARASQRPPVRSPGAQ